MRHTTIDEELLLSMSAGDEFFERQAGHSLAKSQIVSKYVSGWAWILADAASRLVYLDLFCGPGRYDDGSLSTPLLILRDAIAKPRLANCLQCVFNDRDPDAAQQLQQNIDLLDGVASLAYQPKVAPGEVSSGDLIDWAKRVEGSPTFLFLDPWGYKGISLDDVDRFIQPFGSECAFFFNYRRVNAAISNPALRQPTDAFFGRPRAEELRQVLQDANPDDRERLVFEAIESALKNRYGRYVLRFRLAGESRGADYYLVHVTKGWKGYEVMRDIMAKVSPADADGVPWFECNPDRRPRLFALTGSLAELEKSLVGDFVGMSVTFGRLFESHSVGRMYIKRNYKRALANLARQGRASVDYPQNRLDRGWLPDDRVITFPRAKD